MADVQLSIRSILGTDQVCQGLNFLRQNYHTTADFIITDFRHHHFFTDIAAVFVVAHTVALQTLFHLGRRHIVLTGDIFDSTINSLVRDSDLHLSGHLHHDVVHDKTFKNLLT